MKASARAAMPAAVLGRGRRARKRYARQNRKGKLQEGGMAHFSPPPKASGREKVVNAEYRAVHFLIVKNVSLF